MKKINLVFLSILLFPLAGCNDFLEQSPSKNADFEIETVEHLEALLSNEHWQTVDYNLATQYCTDCFDLTPELFKSGFNSEQFNETSLACVQLGMWAMPCLESATPETTQWGHCFNRIYLANLILDNLPYVTGSEEAKATVKAKAHMLRAYEYLDLVQIYCMPYGPSTLNEQGLPIKTSTGFEEDMHRVSLQKTYEFIESDIREAVKLQTPLFVNGERKSWQETGATANALAARFYLTKGDYAQASEYAAAALGYDSEPSDYNTDIKQESYHQTKVPSTWNISILTPDAATADKAFYSRYNYFMAQNIWLLPSEKLLNLYDQDYDLRYRYFIIPKFQNVFLFGFYAYSFNSNIPGYGIYDHVVTNCPNVAEMHLIQAECAARMGNPDEAMQILNRFRRYRIDAKAPQSAIEKQAASAAEAVNLVLEERMREFPFTLRWYDIRRCNFNDTPEDDIVVTRTFYPVTPYVVEENAEPITYTLSPETRNYAVAIPLSEIISSDGVIEQNRY